MRSFLTRREFLERSACTAAVAALATRGLSAAPSGMWVSMNGALTTGKNVAWPEFARLAARAGFGGVDFPLPSLRTAGVDATNALLAELKLKPTVTGLPFSIQAQEAAYQTGLAQLDDAAKFMADIGASRMMAVLPTTTPQPVAEFRAMYKERLTAVGQILAKHNVRLGLEFLGPLYFRTRAGQNPFIWTLPETVKLATEAGPNIGAVLDAWHWHHSGATVADILAVDKSRIVEVHVSDAKEMPPEDVRDNMRLMPGEGIINLVGFFQALQKIGYEGGVSPEPLGRITPEMTAEDSAKLGYDTTSAVMKKAGVL